MLVPVGPMSNIATAFTAEPRLRDLVPELVIMGGANRYGNVTPRAEFNVWADPEAARIVLGSGVRRITLVPLDATHRAPSRSMTARRWSARHAGGRGRRELHRAAHRGL